MTWQYIAFLGVLVTVGATVLVTLYLSGRRALRSAPDRDIPGAGELPTPAYVSAEALRGAPAAPDSPLDLEGLDGTWRSFDGRVAPGFQLGALPGLADARVVVTEEITWERELLGILAAMGRDDCLLVATQVSEEVVRTLQANWAAGWRRVIPVVSNEGAAIAAWLGSETISREDLQSGWTPTPATTASWRPPLSLCAPNPQDSSEG